MRRILVGLLCAQAYAQPVPMAPYYNTNSPMPPPACAPGYFGPQWPASQFRYSDDTENGWIAWGFCKDPQGQLAPVYRVCAFSDGCKTQDVIWGIVGTMLMSAVGNDRTQFVAAYVKDNPTAYRCFIYPPGATIPAMSASMATMVPEPGSGRAKVCADVLAKMQAAWPMQVAGADPPASAPTLPAGTWKAIGGSIFNSNGKSLTGLTTRKAASGAVCDNTVFAILVTTRTFLPLVGGDPLERTECKQ